MSWKRGDVAMIDYEIRGKTHRVVAHRTHYFGSDEPWMVNIWGFLKVTDQYIDAHNPTKLVEAKPS